MGTNFHNRDRRNLPHNKLVSVFKNAAVVTGLSVMLTACGGGSFDTGGPREFTAFLGTTNLQQINDYFVATQGADALTCAELGCHGTDPDTGAGTLGGGGFKFRNKLWANLTPEEQLEQQVRLETRVDFDNKLQSAILLRATQPAHSGSVGGSGGAPRYTSSDQIYLWIEEWLNSTPSQ